MASTIDTAPDAGSVWLTRYYFARAAFSLGWVGAAIGLAASPMAVLAALLLIYPAWDAIANFVDAQRNGGLKTNPTQAVNAGVSVVTTIAVGIALSTGMNDVLRVFGVQAGAPEAPHITAIAPYAAFGAFYFLISAVWLAVRAARRRRG